MTLLVPAESVMQRVFITLFMTCRYPMNNCDVYDKTRHIVESFV